MIEQAVGPTSRSVPPRVGNPAETNEGREMREAEVLPLDVSDRVAAIADEAIHAAFAEIAEQLKAVGYEVTGDFAPEELRELEHAFQGYVLSMALNNPKIAEMNDRG